MSLSPIIDHGHDHGHDNHDHSDTSSINKPGRANLDGGSTTPSPRAISPVRLQGRPPQPSATHRRSQSIPVRESTDSSIEPFGHPATLRESFNIAADEMRKARSPSPPPRGHARTLSTPAAATAEGFEGMRDQRSRSDHLGPHLDEPQDEISETSPLIRHADSSHQGKSPSGTPNHGHSHGSMNMKAILLHVLGDALGNVGVIATGLIIWKTTWSFKYYCDPIISLIITVIIFSSAMPLGKLRFLRFMHLIAQRMVFISFINPLLTLTYYTAVRSTAYILLQGVPSNIALGKVRKAILQVKGVLDLHELHVWQLSETKVVASVHISASREHDFMHVAAQIQEALHHCGIHSATIQPEYTTPGAVIVRKVRQVLFVNSLVLMRRLTTFDPQCFKLQPVDFFDVFDQLPV